MFPRLNAAKRGEDVENGVPYRVKLDAARGMELVSSAKPPVELAL